jgi:hypothetical protein
MQALQENNSLLDLELTFNGDVFTNLNIEVLAIRLVQFVLMVRNDLHRQ